ncbi:MvaI/BcnI family restriction endonuclease [Acetobacter orleanensis]|uniref:MvaI/BcnI restriction endonuclease domain-containing protein n=1 Tax=Acetobacter orleanensis TaxID=104099 RepID=A0A4Y3TRQ0_9PROT|nr:MvaI/BcnI family restriction endonuclease [Acetobacter orleanensis]KXV66606.1 hypothetical protein AD949_02155 [Acetobacter orleanensis]PCD78456.1 glycosyl hydrolase [Acetobacter orleanensis]GAN69852.1 glycosyl hydrolase [Acetobacter orleanensis JCM 7639]GBR22070.1 glycosyl hydrolase [Acetobacter orleanensis NRIC 0473]GEB84159.1 hypothetical protein AOR01nite_26360 [Acetobacter orleanensis]
MCDDISRFKEDFLKVKDLGFVRSSRTNSTGVGKTFEDFVGVAENNLKEPDLHGFEVKAQRSYSGSYVTLCTKSPTHPIKANQYIKDKYGYPDQSHPNIKVIHTSIFHNKFSINSYSGVKFRLQVDLLEKRVYVLVFNLNEEVIDSSIYYSFESIDNALRKIKNLAYVSAQTEKRNFEEFFHFTNAILFSEMKGLDHFLQEIINGNIMYDVRIGAYKSGNKIGKAHDHGSGFRIKRMLLNGMYDKYLEI